MKRANSSSGKKTHIPSDFKRLKAKVGKRAPQKANVTDTKFRTAAVQVRTQTIVDGKTGNGSNKESSDKKNQQEMVSSKGKHLPQLLAQLNHPSPNIRISALQGIKDATKNTSDDAIPNYLSVLVPSLSKAIVDDDSKVRKLAKSIFFQDVTARILANQDNDKMKPFLPLSLAYIASALHSLDQDVRYDGCIALESLCTSFRNDLNGDKEIYSLFTTIPAFVTLFDDVGGGVASVSRRGMSDVGNKSNNNSNSSKKEKKKKQSSSSEKCSGVLRSFISLMKVATLTGQEEIDIDKTWALNSDTMKRLAPNGSSLLPSSTLPNLMFLPGGMASNAIVWNQIDNDNLDGRKRRSSKFGLKGLGDLSHMLKTSETKYSSSRAANKSLTITTQINLLSKLRNRLMEVTQRGNHESNGGLFISSHDTHEYSLMVSTLRLLWNCHPRYFDNECEANIKYLSKDGKVNEWKKFKKLAHILLNMLLDVLPIRDPSGNPTNQHNYDLLNASLCCAISEFGSVLDPPKKSSNDEQIKNPSNTANWVGSIFSYLLPKLKDGNELDVDDDTNANVQQRNSRVTLMKVIEQLLLRQESGICFLDDESKQMELLKTFASLFFSNTNKPNERLCRSLEGRRAVYILISLIAQNFQSESRNEDEENNQDESEKWQVLSEMAMVLPTYLTMWRGSFAEDSTLVLSTLLACTRRCDVTSVESTSSTYTFCSSIRESISHMFTTPECPDSVSNSKISVFEELSSYTAQKLAVSLLGMLSYPSESLVSSLVQICARHNIEKKLRVSGHIIDYIMDILYSVKNTLALEQYSTFLIESTGFSVKHFGETEGVKEQNKSADERGILSNEKNFICSFDKALAKSCRYLCLLLNEDQNIIQCLKPHLITWLEGRNESIVLHKMKARAAIIIISCWSVLLTENSCYFDLVDDLRAGLLGAICDLFLSSSDLFREENNQLISPIMVLFRSHPDLFCSVLRECGERVTQSNTKDDTNSKALIANLLFLVANKSLLETMRQNEVAEVITNVTHRIESSTSDGPLEMIAGTLAIQVQSLFGFKK